MCRVSFARAKFCARREIFFARRARATAVDRRPRCGGPNDGRRRSVDDRLRRTDDVGRRRPSTKMSGRHFLSPLTDVDNRVDKTLGTSVLSIRLSTKSTKNVIYDIFVRCQRMSTPGCGGQSQPTGQRPVINWPLTRLQRPVSDWSLTALIIG